MTLDTMTLSIQAERQLLPAGWYASRACDVKPFIQAYEEWGYTVLHEAVDFLAPFGWLEGWHRVHEVADLKHFSFNACRAIEETPQAWVRLCEQKLGEGVLPVGKICSGHRILLMSKSGRLLAGDEEALYLLGADRIDGLNGLFESRHFERLHRIR